MSLKHSLSYGLIRLISYPFSLMSYKLIHRIGRALGSCAYYLDRHHRKRVLNNLAIAESLQLSHEERKKIAKESFQNLVITTMEYFRLKASRNNLEEIVTAENRELLDEIYDQGKGFIIFSGHQSNWEVPFLELTRCWKGAAIGRPIKNKALYDYILSIRQLFGGKVIPPKSALKSGTQILKEGHFFGFAGDQGLPESSYSYPFFGTRAWTSAGPAILAYKTNSPIIVLTNKRENNKYTTHYSKPIYPNVESALKTEVIRMMDEANKLLEDSIRHSPGEYLWQHNKWKQTEVNHVKREYRHDFILIALPEDPEKFHSIFPYLNILKKVYARGFFTFLIPQKFRKEADLDFGQCLFYENESELYRDDWKTQMLLDFIDSKKMRQHYLNKSAFKALRLSEILKLAKRHQDYASKQDLSHSLLQAFCKNNSAP